MFPVVLHEIFVFEILFFLACVSFDQQKIFLVQLRWIKEWCEKKAVAADCCRDQG